MSVTSKQYVCFVCEQPVKMAGDGLKTATCPKHPSRMVTVTRDTSGGSEQLRDKRKEPVMVKRHTQVKVVKIREEKP
jgi:hypothetical protein